MKFEAGRRTPSRARETTLFIVRHHRITEVGRSMQEGRRMSEI